MDIFWNNTLPNVEVCIQPPFFSKSFLKGLGHAILGNFV